MSFNPRGLENSGQCVHQFYRRVIQGVCLWLSQRLGLGNHGDGRKRKLKRSWLLSNSGFYLESQMGAARKPVCRGPPVLVTNLCRGLVPGPLLINLCCGPMCRVPQSSIALVAKGGFVARCPRSVTSLVGKKPPRPPRSVKIPMFVGRTQISSCSYLVSKPPLRPRH